MQALPNSNEETQNTHPRMFVTILHTSDLHLTTVEDTAGAWDGFNRTLQVAQDIQADAMLIAGDLFDSPDTDPKVVTTVFDILGQQTRPTVILPGNHDGDVMSRNGHYRDLPGNIHLLLANNGELVRIPQLGLVVWGKPVYDHTPSFRPLHGLPRLSSDATNVWYIAMAHGWVVETDNDIFASSPIYPEELLDPPCDYIAMGHVHVYRDVTRGLVPVIYSGAPSGPYQTSVAIVRLSPDKGVSVEPYVLAPSPWSR